MNSIISFLFNLTFGDQTIYLRRRLLLLKPEPKAWLPADAKPACLMPLGILYNPMSPISVSLDIAYDRSNNPMMLNDLCLYHSISRY